MEAVFLTRGTHLAGVESTSPDSVTRRQGFHLGRGRRAVQILSDRWPVKSFHETRGWIVENAVVLVRR